MPDLQTPTLISEKYAEALLRYLEHPTEGGRLQANDLGRQAVMQHISVLDLTLIHHRTLAQAIREWQAQPADPIVELAATFLGEALTVYELTLRCFQDATAQIRLFLVGGPPAGRSNVSLTNRELDMLRLLSQGFSTAAIAQQFSLSPVTVSNHISRLLTKLGVHSRIEAVAAAHRAGLI